MQIKFFRNYSIVPDRCVSKGRSQGIWVTRVVKNVSKGSLWLFKSGGGIRQTSLPKNIAGDLHAVKEAYAGELYQLFIPQYVPKTRLVIADNDNNDAYRYMVGSKEIKNFKPSSESLFRNKMFISAHDMDVVKVFVVAMLLGEIDFGHDNCGLSLCDNRFVKIDHGESLTLDEHGKKLIRDWNVDNFFNVNYWVKMSGNLLPKQYFTQENLAAAFNDICKVDLNKLAISASEYEMILTKYRNKFSEQSYYLAGSKEGAMIELITARILLLKNMMKNVQQPINKQLSN